MKNLVIILMAFATISLSAQTGKSEKREARKEMWAKYTPEQKADLRTKQIALKLDLNQSQQDKVKKLYLEEAKNKPKKSREEMKALSADEKHTAKMAMMDSKIAFKSNMKQILDTKQYEEWTSHMGRKRNQFKNKRSRSNKVEKR